ncbi:hypothetical protein K474DRAFT_1668261 [Panus rudis PR-1116 ss-1]|nr:hypothetical protein K474DRAFT_1668261 [Panus rudis PR-1116 ss-1]
MSRPAQNTQSLFNTTNTPGQWKRITVLPDDTKVDALTTKDETTIALDGIPIVSYRVLPYSLRLEITSVGTPYHNKAEHVPSYPVLEIGPPSLTNDTKNKNGKTNEEISIEDFWGVLHGLHTILHTQETIPIVFSSSLPPSTISTLTTYLLQSGLARRKHVPHGHPIPPPTSISPSDPELFLLRGTFWQGAGTGGYHHPERNRSWLRGENAKFARVPFPYTPSFTRSPLVITAHPLRPPKPAPGELVYRKYFPTIGQSLELHYVDLEDADGNEERVGRHLEAFHRWHNHPLVNKGWGEAGPIEKHRKYLKDLIADPAVLPLMMSWDGELMGYTELVYIKENHVAQHIQDGARDYDRGLHVLVGEDKFRGADRSVAWFGALLHYLLLADPRTERVIGEPKAANPRIVKLSLDVGMHLQTIFDFPYKRSVLTWHTRDRYFKYDNNVGVVDGEGAQMSKL